MSYTQYVPTFTYVLEGMRDAERINGPALSPSTFISPWELYYIRVIAWN